MNSYLGLIPISAKVRKRQNRMTIICIVISVLLVTAVFSLTDMLVRSETLYMQSRHGSWHIKLNDISEDVTAEIMNYKGITAAGWLEVFNTDADKPYFVNEKKATLYGTDTTYMNELASGTEEGNFPEQDNEVMLSSNAQMALDVNIGDSVTLHTPTGDASFIISGFGSDDSEYYQGQNYLIGVYMTISAFDSLMEQNSVNESPSLYLKFQSAANASEAREAFYQYGLTDKNISENTAVMGLSGQSKNKSLGNFYSAAAAVFIMVLMAGILMISGSMNSSISQLIKFFGLMRCIGASRSQVKHFVLLEALNWCKTAVPAGIVLGTVISCGVCAVLRYCVGGEFAEISVFAVSPIGIVSGAAVGIVTVLLAAQTPARYASKASPVSAVSGNVLASRSVRHKSGLGFGRIELSLGMHHATGSGKNLFLMTASFSLSIILCFCLSVGLEFAEALLPSMREWQPDIALNGYGNAPIADSTDIIDKINTLEDVEYVFGCAYFSGVSASSSRQGVNSVNLLSYDKFLTECAGNNIIEGNISDISGDSGKVMIVRNKDNPLQVGDTFAVNGNELTAVCSVSDSLYPSEYLLICSQETFFKLTGIRDSSLIGVRLNSGASDETVRTISGLAKGDVIFSDMRESNRQDRTTFLALKFAVCGFIAIVAMITLFYIINSISMSVWARIKQYGAMRAVGMDGSQLTRMIAAEAFTYAVWGLIFGCGLGIPFSKLLYEMLITKYFGISWHLPLTLLIIVTVFVLASVIAAVYAPAKRIRNMPVTETINECQT